MAGVTTAVREGERRDSGPPSSPGRRGRWLPGPRALAFLLVMALLGGFCCWAVYGSGWLRVERVAVHWREGPRKLTGYQIRTAARVPLDIPMASLDKEAVRERLLTGLPRLAAADVVRGWPDGVTLKVTERETVLLLRTPGGYREVDAGGLPFADAAGTPVGVPLLALEPEEGPSLRRFGEPRLRRAAATVAGALPRSVHRDTEVVRVVSYDAIVLELSGGRTVRWGSAERSAAKAEALMTVMKAAPGAAHFDVSVPSAPAVSGG